MKFLTYKDGQVHFPQHPRLDQWLTRHIWTLVKWLWVALLVVVAWAAVIAWRGRL